MAFSQGGLLQPEQGAGQGGSFSMQSFLSTEGELLKWKGQGLPTDKLSSENAIVKRYLELEALQEAAYLTVMRAAWLADEGQPNNVEASIAKAKGGQAVRIVTQGCIEILGPMGISQEYLLEKWFRDCRIIDIYEGTGQIQHLIIARALMDYTRADLS